MVRPAIAAPQVEIAASGISASPASLALSRYTTS
jgi:hypothetical protein